MIQACARGAIIGAGSVFLAGLGFIAAFLLFDFKDDQERQRAKTKAWADANDWW